MDSPELTDLRDRLIRARVSLEDAAHCAPERGVGRQEARLIGKAQGVTLAISYVEEYLRGAVTVPAVSA